MNIVSAGRGLLDIIAGILILVGLGFNSLTIPFVLLMVIKGGVSFC